MARKSKNYDEHKKALKYHPYHHHHHQQQQQQLGEEEEKGR